MSRLAREFTAFVIKEPHSALSSSDNQLLEDSHYYKVFSTEYDLDIYRLVLDVHVRVRQFLREYTEDFELLGGTTENWRHHIAYLSSFALTRLRNPTTRDLLNIDMNHLTGELLEKITKHLDKEYKAALRGNRTEGIDRIARSSIFTTRIRQSLIEVRRFGIVR